LSTTQVRCGSLVYSVGYRHPAVLANAIATIDQLSGGRVTLGLGAGWHQGEYDAYGIPFPSPGVRLRQLDEAIQCIRGLLTEDVTTFEGEFFQLHDARCEPKPVQARLPLWVGGGGERVTMRLAARHADGWNVPFLPPDDYARKIGVLDEHCAREGRDPAAITRAVNVGLARDERSLEAQFGNLGTYLRPGVLMGGPQEIVDRIGAYRDAGAEWLNVAIRAPFDVDGLDRFAAEVLPAFER
jgi:alkanesulfonate monooxygenase SsuD/methylene tetrahydromethanopterin reductase-like flavin-dependent oxidoreductase (luciferase family)